MPKITVNGVELAYEIYGNGPPLIWTPGGWLPRDNHGYLIAGRLSVNFRVVLWDRRDCGQSDVALDLESPSEWHPYVEDLHELLNQLDMSPAYLAGGSGGCVMSLLMAHRFPKDVRGLVLNAPPTNDLEPLGRLMGAHYLECAELAEQKGMEAVAEERRGFPHFWFWSQLTKRNPENRERLLSIDREEFAALMRRWHSWTMSGRFHLAGLTDEELSQIKVPTIVAHLLVTNELHPAESARELHRLLPDAEWVDYRKQLSAEEIFQIEEDDPVAVPKQMITLPIWEDFLNRVESTDSGVG